MQAVFSKRKAEWILWGINPAWQHVSAIKVMGGTHAECRRESERREREGWKNLDIRHESDRS